MAIHNVKNDKGRTLAHIRTHGNQYVSLSQVYRWSPDDVRLVAEHLLAIVDAPAPEVAGSAGDASPTGPAVEAGAVKEPPLRGPGSSRAAWVAYARSRRVAVSGTMTREDIQHAVHAAEPRPGEVGAVTVEV